MAQVNRNNHPLLVKARRDAYFAGRTDGYKAGYQKGYGERCEEIHRYYKIIIHALETRIALDNKEIQRLKGEAIHNG